MGKVVSYSLIAPDGSVICTGTFERCMHIKKLNPNSTLKPNYEQDLSTNRQT
jgi:hypothetical protein